MLVILLSMVMPQGMVAQPTDGTPVAEEPLQPEGEEAPEPDGTPNSLAREIDDDPTDPEQLPHGRIDITAYQCLQHGFEFPDEVAQFDVPDAGEVGDDIVGDFPDEVYVEEEFAGCTPDYTGATFQIAVRENQTRSQTAVSSGNPAVASFPGAFAEPLYIMSPMPPNFRRDPVVICGSSIAGPMRFEGPTSDYGIVMYDLQENETLTCNWYFIQLQVPGTIVLTVRFCPTDGLRPDDRLALEAACTDIQERLSFTATPQGTSQGLERDMENDGSVRYDDISPGTWVVTQESLGIFDEPAVFCRSTTAGEPGIGRWFAVDTIGSPANAVTLSVGPDATVACQWYVAKQGFIRFAEGNTLLGMNFAGCPAGFDPATSTIYDFAQFCHEPLPPISATIAQPNGASMTSTADSSDFNFLEFDFIAGVPVVATVDVVPGYVRVVPFCDPRTDGIPGNSDTNPEPVSGADMNVFTVELLPDIPNVTLASCAVYYIMPESGGAAAPEAPDAPEDAAEVAVAEPGTLIVTVHGCPVGTTVSDDLAGTCAEAITGVTFTALSMADESIESTSEGDVIASAAFDGLASGTWVITQGDVDDYSDAVTVCDGVVTDVVDGAVSVSVAPGSTTVCDWYLLPSKLQMN
jgi:hypothetical protein